MNSWRDAFGAAYAIDAGWAVANLTTWLVWVSLASIAVNSAVVIAAFEVQRREFRRRAQDENSRKLSLYLQAVGVSRDSLSLFDVVFYKNARDWSDFSVSDVTGRLTVFVEMIEHFLGLGITDRVIVNALMTTRTLMRRAIQDVQPFAELGDRHPAQILIEIGELRKGFRDGVEKIIELAEAHRSDSLR